MPYPNNQTGPSFREEPNSYPQPQMESLSMSLNEPMSPTEQPINMAGLSSDLGPQNSQPQPMPYQPQPINNSLPNNVPSNNMGIYPPTNNYQASPTTFVENLSMSPNSLNETPNNMPSQSPINLQPEGIYTEGQSDVPEPLMGTTLTADVNLTNDPSKNVKPIPQTDQNIYAVPPFTNGPMNGPAPVPESEPQKKKSLKTPLIIIIVLLLVGALGIGVYYVLHTSQPSTPKLSVTPVLTEWEKGEELPEDIAKYATITGIEPTSCTLDKSNININEDQRYKYTISCPGLSNPIEGEVIVKDTQGPKVITKDVTITPNTAITIDNFIFSCEDASIQSGCDIQLSDTSINLDDLASQVGTHEINIVASDDYNHKTEITANLIVSDDADEMTLSCNIEKPSTQINNSTMQEIYYYGINDENLLSSVKKTRIYTFKTDEDYNEAKVMYGNTSNEIEGLSGEVKFIDNARVMIVSANIEISDLPQEFEVEEFPSAYEDIITFHDNRSEECSQS